jgi:hypothetical protein
MKKEQLEQVAESTAKDEKLKLRDVVNGLQSLNLLGEQKLPVFTSFKISLFIKSIAPIIETYDKERNKLVTELGIPVKNKDGKETSNYNFEKEKGEEFTTKINELLDEVIDVKVPAINVKDLGDIKIKPKSLLQLAWMLKE